MHPRSEGNQRCFVFQLSVNPRARIFGYTDSYGNLVHHFDLPSRHTQLTIVSDALVNIEAQSAIPEVMEYGGWQELEELVEKKDYWDMLMPSHFARSSPQLEQLAERSVRTKGRDEVPWHSCRIFPPACIALSATLRRAPQSIRPLRTPFNRGRVCVRILLT